MIKQQLTKESYIVDACTSGEDGMIYALNPDNGYALAIIDRMLPVIDGLTIIKAMRKKNDIYSYNYHYRDVGTE